MFVTSFTGEHTLRTWQKIQSTVINIISIPWTSMNIRCFWKPGSAMAPPCFPPEAPRDPPHLPLRLHRYLQIHLRDRHPFQAWHWILARRRLFGASGLFYGDPAEARSADNEEKSPERWDPSYINHQNEQIYTNWEWIIEYKSQFYLDPCMLYMVTWIPSIYPLYVSIYIPAPWIRHGLSFISWWYRYKSRVIHRQGFWGWVASSQDPDFWARRRPSSLKKSPFLKIG